jgi:hypothetical protein
LKQSTSFLVQGLLTVENELILTSKLMTAVVPPKCVGSKDSRDPDAFGQPLVGLGRISERWSGRDTWTSPWGGRYWTSHHEENCAAFKWHSEAVLFSLIPNIPTLLEHHYYNLLYTELYR